MRNLIPIALMACLVQTADAQSPKPAEAAIRAENCAVKLIREARVPAEVEGTLTEMKIEEGTHVKKGDILAVIDDTRAKLALQLKKAEELEARLNAENDVNLKDAINSEKTAAAEYESYVLLDAKGAVPYWEKEKKKLEAERAKLRIDLAMLQEEIAKVQYAAKQAERQLAEVEVDRRRVAAPFGGYVEFRIAHLGEWVQPGSPVAHLVQLDTLRVEGDIDASQFPTAVVPGTPVDVTIHVGADKQYKVTARIGFVSSKLDARQRCRVWVEIQNVQQNGMWVIKPGMRADMVVREAPELAQR